MNSKCYDCGLAYGDDGFADLIVSNSVWRRITPTEDLGGLLCPTCLIRALVRAGIQTEGAFMSGPIINVTQPIMQALRQIENLQEGWEPPQYRERRRYRQEDMMGDGNCLLFHEWTKWSQYTWEGTIYLANVFDPKDVRGKSVQVTELRQGRVCKRCGKAQDERL